MEKGRDLQDNVNKREQKAGNEWDWVSLECDTFWLFNSHTRTEIRAAAKDCVRLIYRILFQITVQSIKCPKM